MTELTEKRFLNIQEVAKYLSFTIPAIRAWVRLGKIPFYKIGRAVRFDRSEIDAWADKKKCADFLNKPRLFSFFRLMMRKPDNN
jgi:excisionase family DNA binding protein